MAKEEKATTEQKSSGIKGIIGYGIFFIVSFIVTFGALYFLMRGAQNPFSKIEQAADSTAVAIDSTEVEQEPDPEAEERKRQREIEEKVKKIARDRILEKEYEVEELKQQIETLKFAYEENRRRYRELATTTISSDSLKIIIDELEKQKKDVAEKEETIAELDSVTHKLKTLVKNVTLADTTEKIEPDSVEKVLAELDKEREEKKKQQENIKELEQKIENLKKEDEKKNDVNISKLAKVYNAMKPADAAQIMKNLNDELVIEILRRVKQRQAAKILSQLPPARAARISQSLGK